MGLKTLKLFDKAPAPADRARRECPMPEIDATPPDDAQAAIIRFLSNPANYEDAPDTVDVIETHGARVFLAGARAFKIKRAVAYDYMDFSTLKKRRAALMTEFEINHPHAPEIYQRVVPVTRAPDGTLALDGAGDAIDWVLVMTRFDQSHLLSAIAARGALDTPLAERVADAIAAYHDAATPVPTTGGAARLEKTIVHLATSGLCDPTIAEPNRITAWQQRARAHLEAHRELLDRRAAAGDVRRAHGDLHLANIVVLDGTPRLFDAIEFDDNIRTVDRLYDLAFLLMDLDINDHAGPANTIFNRYLVRPNTNSDTDLDALALMPLFLSLRAAIRAMVAGQRANLTASSKNRHNAEHEAHAYFDRSAAYLTPTAPRLIVIGGLSGTGKTTLARSLAPGIPPAPGAVIVRSDIERKRLFAVPETTRLPAASYTRKASEKVYDRLFEKARRILAAGHSVILDAVFSKAHERDEASRIATATGLPISGLWLEAPPETMRARVAARTGDASDATPAVVDAQLAAGPGPLTWTRVTAGGNPAETLTNARKALGPPPDRAEPASLKQDET
jgi:aminoglycoside phosphotransferase family enzyme/predicted kinase